MYSREGAGTPIAQRVPASTDSGQLIYQDSPKINAPVGMARPLQRPECYVAQPFWGYLKEVLPAAASALSAGLGGRLNIRVEYSGTFCTEGTTGATRQRTPSLAPASR